MAIPVCSWIAGTTALSCESSTRKMSGSDGVRNQPVAVAAEEAHAAEVDLAHDLLAVGVRPLRLLRARVERPADVGVGQRGNRRTVVAGEDGETAAAELQDRFALATLVLAVGDQHANIVERGTTAADAAGSRAVVQWPNPLPEPRRARRGRRRQQGLCPGRRCHVLACRRFRPREQPGLRRQSPRRRGPSQAVCLPEIVHWTQLSSSVTGSLELAARSRRRQPVPAPRLTPAAICTQIRHLLHRGAAAQRRESIRRCRRSTARSPQPSPRDANGPGRRPCRRSFAPSDGVGAGVIAGMGCADATGRT